MADRDSRLRGAKTVGLPSNVSGNFRASNDLDDLVRFRTNERSSFNLNLTRIARRNNVDVELYRFKRPVAAVLRSIGKIDFRALKPRQRNQNFSLVAASRKAGNRAENISTTLESDNYFIRLLRRQGTRTNYSMALTATPSPIGGTPIPDPGGPIPDPGGPIPDPGGPIPDPNVPVPTPLTPIPLTTPSVTAQLTAAETRKRYSVSIPTGDFKFKLTGLSSDADLEIRSADGNTVLNSSLNSGTANEQLIQPLDGGSYFIDVVRKAGNTSDTSFTLNYAKLTDSIKNLEADPTFLGNIGSATAPPTIERVNYVVAGGKDSPTDVYSFTLPNRGFVKVSLAGAPIDGDTLFGDLDVELYAQGKTVQDGLASNSLGKTVGEVFGGTLAAKEGGNTTTYLLRVAPKTGTTDGSTYKLRIEYRGTSDNPSIVRDILPGSDPSDAQNFVEVNGIAYFSASSVDAQGQRKVSLWASEGGTLDGTTKIFDFNANTSLSQFTNVNNKLYFVVNDPATGGRKLWTSDGLASGTLQVADPTSGAPINSPQQLVGVGQDLYFYTEVLTGGGFVRNQQLYRLRQGQNTAEALVSTDFKQTSGVTTPNFQNSLVNVGGTLYFAAEGTQNARQLWRVNAGGGGSPVIEQMLLNTEGSADPQDLINAGGQLFLTASIEEAGFNSRELIRINTFSTGIFNPANFEKFNLNGDNPGDAGNLTYIDATKTLYFTGNDVVNNGGETSNTGIELFKLQFGANTNENVPATLVSDIAAGTSDSNPSDLVTLGNRVLFLASDGGATELWISDGTTTSKLSQLTGLGDLAGLSGIKELTVVNSNTLFFVASNGTIGEELWKMTLDGSTGTLKFFDIQSGVGSSSPNALAVAGGQVFFVANDGVNGNEPWSLPA